jgi:hypothetical protein
VTGDAIARLRTADPLHGELPAALERMPARPLSEPHQPPRGSTALTIANVLLLATVLFHVADHTFIQERGVSGLSFEVMLGGMAITATAALSLAVALRRDRRAALYALWSGPWIAAAVVLGHFVGHWGEFSDRYADADVGAISYAAAFAVVAAGVALGAVGAVTSLRSRTAPS